LLAVVLVVGIATGGRVAPDGGRAVKSVVVAAIQGGGPRGFGNEEVSPSSVYSAQLSATYAMEERDLNHRVRLVIWPEDVIALPGPLAHSAPEQTMAQLSRTLHATVVAGVTAPAPDRGFLNEVVAWGPSGKIAAIFEKVHRVPFGEYVPFRSFFAHFANLSAVPLDAVPGHGSGLIHTPAGPLGIMVSYEVFYANRSRPSVSQGAELLVVPTNTSSYATSQVPTQEVAADEVQAVQEGRDLVQAAPTGYSTVVNHDGQLVQRSILGKAQFLLATVGLRTGRTIYNRIGDLPVLVLSALMVGTALLLGRREREEGEEGEPRLLSTSSPKPPPANPQPPAPPEVASTALDPSAGFQAPSLLDVTREHRGSPQS
jgi:apolipoprotein N-acyltransferase